MAKANSLFYSVLVCFVLVLLALTNVFAANPGHGAASVGSGTFEGGDYVFPNNLSVSQNFSVNGSTLFVDGSTGRVGIGTNSPSYKLDVAGTGRYTGNLDANSGVDVSGLAITSSAGLTVSGGIVTISDGVGFNFDRITGTSPFTVDSTTVVTNLNADLLDGQNGAYYLDNTDTQLTQEQVEDFTGGMVTGNTETGIVVTYQDADGTIDFVATDTSASNELQTISTSGSSPNIQINLSNGGGSVTCQALTGGSGLCDGTDAYNSAFDSEVEVEAAIFDIDAETISGVWTYSARPAFNGGASGSTSPFTVDSTTVVANLNADLLDGNEATAFQMDLSDSCTGENVIQTVAQDGTVGCYNTYSATDDVVGSIAEWQSGCTDCVGVNDIGDVLTASEITDIYLFNSGTEVRSGNLNIYGTDTTGTYSNAPVEIREVNLITTGQSSWAYAPALAFHWGGRVQTQLKLLSTGALALGTADGTYSDFMADDITLSGDIYESGTQRIEFDGTGNIIMHLG